MDSDNPKVAVLSINIGNYIRYWEEFYLTCKNNFLPGYEKHFFVFSDQEQIEYEHEPDVTLIHQDDLGWPGNTLYRYHMFCRIDDILLGFDYVFYANANLIFEMKVDESVLPSKGEKLVFVRRDQPYLAKEKQLPYESNPQSTAYVNSEQNSLYVRGGFNGGRSDAFISMCRTLKHNIDIDEKNGIVAVWHDESHITKYAIDHQKEAKILFPGYLYPKGWVMPYSKKILIRPKDNGEVRYGVKQKNIKKIKHKLFLICRNLIYSFLIAVRILPFENG